MTRRLTLAASALIAAVAPEVPAAADTAAVAQQSSCPSGNLCVWPQIDYIGSRGEFDRNDNDWRTNPQEACPDDDSSNNTWHNCVSSAKNRKPGHRAVLYKGQGYTGETHTIGIGGDRQDLGFYHWRRVATSHRFYMPA